MFIVGTSCQNPGESWRIGYRGTLDLPQQRFDLVTLPSSGKRTPVTLQVRVNQFLAQPSWSVLARLDKAPAGNLLPLAQRLRMSKRLRV